MGLRLVRNDGEALGEGSGEGGAVTVREIEAEAHRRLVAMGIDRHRARHIATGQDMPTGMRVKQLQITAIAMAMAALETIPDDFRSDIYWPL